MIVPTNQNELRFTGPPRIICIPDSLHDVKNLYVVDPNAAIAAMRQAAENGNGDAAAALANMFLNRSIVCDDSLDGATHWAEVAIENGSAYGHWVKGWILLETKRPADGIGSLEDALSQNFAPAALDLGVIHQRGWGVSSDNDASYEYFRKASDLGHLSARWCMLNLGVTGNAGLYNAFICWLERPFARLVCRFRVVLGPKFTSLSLNYPFTDRMVSTYP